VNLKEFQARRVAWRTFVTRVRVEASASDSWAAVDEAFDAYHRALHSQPQPSSAVDMTDVIGE
jgi:hypothetical protein